MRFVSKARLALGRSRSLYSRQERPLRSRLASAGICALAAFMITVCALSSSGSDLRPNRSTELAQFLAAEAHRNRDLAAQLSALRGEVDQLAETRSGIDARTHRTELAEGAVDAALTPVHGPAVRVILSDAPPEIRPPGVAADLLVVHQQDIQAVVNALWSGGAEAMTIQGVRVISTTGIKCVGNSVVLKGVPYAPPYEITAIGDPNRLAAALASSKPVQVFQEYVAAYQLGYEQQTLNDVAMPGYKGSIELSRVTPRA